MSSFLGKARGPSAVLTSCALGLLLTAVVSLSGCASPSLSGVTDPGNVPSAETDGAEGDSEEQAPVVVTALGVEVPDRLGGYELIDEAKSAQLAGNVNCDQGPLEESTNFTGDPVRIINYTNDWNLLLTDPSCAEVRPTLLQVIVVQYPDEVAAQSASGASVASSFRDFGNGVKCELVGNPQCELLSASRIWIMFKLVGGNASDTDLAEMAGYLTEISY